MRSFDAPDGADEPRAAQAFERPRLSHPHHVLTLRSALVKVGFECQIFGRTCQTFCRYRAPVSKFIYAASGPAVKFYPPVSKCQILAGPGAPTIPPLEFLTLVSVRL